MAVNIGPKIELQGEKEFKAQITNVTTATKAYKAEIDSLKSSFDKNTTAEEKAKKTREALTTAIDKQKQKVESLKTAVQQAEAAGNTSENTLNRAKTALANATAELNRMEQELDELPNKWQTVGASIESAGGKIKDFSGKITDVGDKLTTRLTVPIVAAGTAAFKMASDYEENLNKVDVAFGDNADEVKAWASTATEQFGLSQNAALEATSLFGDMGTSMGLTTDEAASMATGLAGLAGDLSSFKNVGIDQAMTALNGVFTGETESLKRLGIVMTETNLKQFAADSGLVYESMSQAEKVQLRYNYVLAQSGNAQGDYARTSDGAANSIRTMQASLSNLGVAFGQQLIPVITPAIQKVTEIIQKFGELDEGQKRTILTIAGVVAVVGPVLSIIGRIGTGIGTVVSAVGTVTTAIGGAGGLTGIISGLGGALASVGTFITATVIPAIGGVLAAIAPVLPIILAVGAAIAGVILVVKNWGAISEWFSGVWDTVTTAVSDAATALKDGIVNAWNSVKEKTTAAWNSLKEKTTAAWNSIKTGVSNAWNGIKNIASTAGAAVKEKVTSAWSTLKSSTSTAWSNIKATVQANGGGIRGIIAGAVEGYKSIWTTGFNVIDSITGGKLSSALATVREKLESIKSAFSEKLNAAKETVSNVIDKIKAFFHFDWSLPHLKMPHLTITGGFSLFPPSVPRFSISWYKKAYNTPMMFKSPTVIPTASGLKGFGDGRGGEVVMGQSMMYAMIRDAVAEGHGGTSNTWGDINVTVNGAESRDMGALADLIADRIAAKVQRRRAAWA